MPRPPKPRAYGEPIREDTAHPLAPILAEARDRLQGIAATSARASAALRERAALDSDVDADEPGLAPAERGLLEALLERIEAVRDETTQLAALLERTKGGLAARADDPVPGAPDPQPEDRDGSDASATPQTSSTNPLDALVKTMAGAGLSRKDIATRVVREHGVVVSERVLDGVAPRLDRAT